MSSLIKVHYADSKDPGEELVTKFFVDYFH